MRNTKGARLYGFEDYKVLFLYEDALFYNNYHMPYRCDERPVTYIVNRNLTREVIQNANYEWKVEIYPELCEDHSEVLETAKKVYVHPSCKISRSLLADKYSKCLSPWLADAIVIPTPNTDDLSLRYVVLFSNDEAKLIVVVPVDSLDFIEEASHITSGTFRELCKGTPISASTSHYKFEDVMNAEFFYAGKCLTVYNNESYITDILTNNLPTDKIIYEETIQKSLSTEDNKITLDVLTNIYDMLNSSDDNTVGAGLKALSMLDYMHYPNSVRYIMRNVTNWNYRYNKACNSTSVKFMFKHLSERSNRAYWPGNYDMDIYPQDFELYKELIQHYETSCNNVYDYLREANFMTFNSDGILIPRIKA